MNGSSDIRRLPIYLLLDCSESMAGEAIEDLSNGVADMIKILRQNPNAIDTAWLSIITFSRYAKQEFPLTDLMTLQVPKLTIRPGTAIGAALYLLKQCIEKEVRRTTSEVKGDYKPLVFIFTDGQPTDEWRHAAEQILSNKRVKIANMYAIGCGPDVDTNILQQITDITFMMKGMTREDWHKVFIWLSASIQTASQAIGNEQSINLPALPDVLEEVTEPVSLENSQPRQVFLHAFCSNEKKPYLMRFGRRGETSRYVAICSHPLEVYEKGDNEVLPPINSSLLDGCPNCPYCGNEAAALCGCGILICTSPSPEGNFTCPSCNQQGVFSREMTGFDINRSQG